MSGLGDRSDPDGTHGAAAGDATPLSQLASVFLKLGLIGFGGPAGHLALMRREIVERHAWLDERDFLDYLAASNLLPGPTSTELALHIGKDRAGWRGLLVAGAAFILPAALLVYTLAWGYVRYGSLPVARGVLYSVIPVVVAIVAQALWAMSRVALRGVTNWVIAIASFVAVSLGWHELLVLAGAALAGSAVWRARRARSIDLRSVVPILSLAMLQAIPAPLTIFATFLKIGSVLFGSGYVLIAFLRADLVERLGWLTEQQLLDAITVGQVTPGPVFTTATFIGYLVGGTGGSIAATLGIFLPAFAFVAVGSRIIPWLQTNPPARAALDAVTAASLALMAVATVQIAIAALVDPITLTIAGISLLLLLTTRVNSLWLILGGLLIGVVV